MGNALAIRSGVKSFDDCRKVFGRIQAYLRGNIPDLLGDMTIEGLWSFSRGAAAPFEVASASALVVANLDADKLDGYHASAFPRKAENAVIAGAWTFNDNITMATLKWIGEGASKARITFDDANNNIDIDDANLDMNSNGIIEVAAIEMDNTGWIGRGSEAARIGFATHIDILSSVLHMNGNPIVVDDGGIIYSSESGARLTFHTTDRIVQLGDRLGIGTATVPHAGVGSAILAIEGTASSGAAGPHVQFTVTDSDHPVLAFLNYSHDNISIFFDSYFQSGSKSSFADSCFRIAKTSNQLQFTYDSGVNPGDALSWKTAAYFDVNGDFNLNQNLYLVDGKSVGIEGNELLTWDAGGIIKVAGAHLLLDGTNEVQFGSADEKIYRGAAGYIDYAAPTAHRFSATVAITGNETITGTLRVGSTLDGGMKAQIGGTLKANKFFTKIDGGGSEATPDFCPQSDPDTGMYHRAGNVLGFSTGGIGRLVIWTDGKVHVGGTTQPTYNLQVTGTFNADSVRIDGAGKIEYRDADLSIGSPSDGVLALTTDGTIVLGDGGTTDYTQIAADGEFVQFGAARTVHQFDIDIAVPKRPSANPPAEGTLDGFPTLDFDDGTEESILLSFHINHGYADAEFVRLHLDFLVNTAPANPANVVWSAQYKLVAHGDNFDFTSGTSTVTVVEAITTGTPANDKKVHETSALVFDTTGWVAGNTVYVRLYRNPGHGSDNFVGDVRLHGQIHGEWLADRLGEAT